MVCPYLGFDLVLQKFLLRMSCAHRVGDGKKAGNWGKFKNKIGGIKY